MDIRISKQRIRRIPRQERAPALPVNRKVDGKCMPLPLENRRVELVDPPVATADEGENVEYLEETISATAGESEVVFNDTFYPNAIHCLIALYRAQYEEMQGKSKQDIRNMHIWDAIERGMNDSYFAFSRWQVRQKFSLLRRQYFGVTTVEDIDSFEYFDNMHEIYQDRIIEKIATGEEVVNMPFPRIRFFPDDVLQEEPLFDDKQPTAADKGHPRAVSAEQYDISVKENLFIDVIENELKAIKRETTSPSPTDTLQQKDEEFANSAILLRQENEVAAAYEHAERTKEEQQLPTAANESDANSRTADTDTADTNSNSPTKRMKLSVPAVAEMSLREYNDEQERRHREKMESARQSLLLQERVIEMQRKLMEQLIKRL